jgi:hypothetical protein
MVKAAKFFTGLGCLASVVAPVMAILLYPRANWLFAFVLLGIAVLVLNHWLVKDPTPQALADEIERLLTGKFSGWDVDDFESRRIRDPQMKELLRSTMAVGSPPQEWVGMDEEKKDRVRDIIRELRSLGETRDAAQKVH